MFKKRSTQSGGLMGDAESERHRKPKLGNTLAAIRADRNKWFYVTVVVVLQSIYANYGWKEADRRYAEDVRLMYVKMSPNGTTDVGFLDGEKTDDFFEASVESKLIEYTERRFSKRPETISPDYGFAMLFQEPELKTDFMENKKAPEEAAKLIACKDCKSVTAHVRDIQGVDKDPMPNTRTRKQYTTLVFATYVTKSHSGKIESCENKIITLLWTFRPKKQVVKRSDELKYNPLGQGIIRETERDDPTPIPEAECRKL